MIELSLIGATISGDEAPSDAVLPELIVIFNLLPSFGGTLETRHDFEQMEFAIGQEGWSADDALCAVWTIPETGATLFGMASGPRDTVGSPLGAESSFSCTVDGAILRADRCIATSVRPGWLVYIPGDPVTHEVVRLVSVDTCQIEAPSTVSGKHTVRFVAAFGRRAALGGLKVENIGATTIVGPSNPNGAVPGARVNGPLAAVIQDEQSKASVPRWISIVRPAWPGFSHPGTCNGMAVDLYGRLLALFDGRILASEDGGATFQQVADISSARPLWLIRAYDRVMVGCSPGGIGTVATLEQNFDITPIAQRPGWIPQFAAVAWQQAGLASVAVLWETERDGVFSAEVEFFIGVPPSSVNTVPLPAGIGQNGLPFGVHGGNRPFQLAATNTSSVLMATELGEVYRIEASGNVTLENAGTDRDEETTAFRLDFGGPWYTKCSLKTPLRTQPYFLSSAGNEWCCILRDLKTFDSQSRSEVAGLYVRLFGHSDKEPLRDGGVPTHPLNPVEISDYTARQAWVDEHCQLFFENTRSEQAINTMSAALVQYGHRWYFDDRGVSTSDAQSPVFTRPVVGCVGDFRILDSGHVVNSTDPPSLAADFSAFGAPLAVASSGAQAVVAFAANTVFFDGSTWNVSGSPPEPMAAGAWDGDNWVFAAASGQTYSFDPGSGNWTLVGAGVLGEAIIAPASAPGYAFFVYPSGVAIVSSGSSVSVLSAPAGETISSGCARNDGGAWSLVVGTLSRSLFSSPPPYTSFQQIGSLPFSRCKMAGGDSISQILVPGLGFPVDLSTYLSPGFASFFFDGIYYPEKQRPAQSGLTITFYGRPIVRPDGQTSWYILDVRQPRALFSAATIANGNIVLWATSCPSGLFSIGDGSSRQDETLVPGASGVGLIPPTMAVVCTGGGIQRVTLGGPVETVDTDGTAIYVGGVGNEAFVVRTNLTTIVRAASSSTVASPQATAAAAAAGTVAIAGPSEFVIIRGDASMLTYPMPTDGVTSPVPVAGTIDPVLIASKGAVRSRWRQPQPIQRLYVFRGGTGWKEIGPTGVDVSAAVFTGGRITVAGNNIADISAWGGGEFKPVSETFWSPVWATTGGHLVLFGVTEIEEGRLVHHRRRVRWSAPLAPFDFDTLEASGLADLYPDTGEFRAAVSLPTGILYGDEFGIGILEPTFDPAAPFSHRRIADIPKTITQMVAVGSSAFFIAEDGWLWQANAAGAQKVRALPLERIFGKPKNQIAPALFVVPSRGLFITDLNGSNRALVVSLPEGRLSAVAVTRTKDDPIRLMTVVDATAISKDLIVSANPKGSVAPRLLAETPHASGSDVIDGAERPWFVSIMTPPINQDLTVSSYAVEVVGSSGVVTAELSSVVIDASEAFWEVPVATKPVNVAGPNTFRLDRPISLRWQTPLTGQITLWAPWWSGRLVDQNGDDVPFNPIDERTVFIDVQTSGYVYFTGRIDYPLVGDGGIALDYSALPLALVNRLADPWLCSLSPEVGGTDWVALFTGSVAKGHWLRRGGLPRFAERPRVLVFGKPAEFFVASSLRLDAVPRRVKGFAESA